MDWKVTAALGVLGVALLVGLAVCIVTSVGIFARRLAQDPDEQRRGFEVKSTTAGTEPGVQREKDDHHG
jgi:hypothetical protein